MTWRCLLFVGKPLKVAESEAILDRLVGFASTSDRSNVELVSFVEDYLGKLGVSSHRVPSQDGLKANLFATIGPKQSGGVVLSAHTDVVPATGQSWRSDPFVAIRPGDRLYGRGTTDMKSFAAIALAMVPEMLAANLKRPIILRFPMTRRSGASARPT